MSHLPPPRITTRTLNISETPSTLPSEGHQEGLEDLETLEDLEDLITPTDQEEYPSPTSSPSSQEQT